MIIVKCTIWISPMSISSQSISPLIRPPNPQICPARYQNEAGTRREPLLVLLGTVSVSPPPSARDKEIQNARSGGGEVMLIKRFYKF